MSGLETGGAAPSGREGRRVRERWVIVLAGGAGRRLRMLTADAFGRTVPKQYCALRGERSLLQMALARAERKAPRERQLVVVDRAHEPWWSRELAEFPPENVVVQPADRGTAVGLFLPLATIHCRDPRAEVVVLPSDHYFGREDVLAEGLECASAEIARQPGRPLLLGVETGKPDPELGWIELGAAAGADKARAVASFHEKPSPVVARQLVERGALANCLILVARVEDLLSLFERHSPLPEHFRALFEQGQLPRDELDSLYEALRPLDLSADLLQTAADDLLALPLGRCGWADLGTVNGVRDCLVRQRPPMLASVTGCRAPVDLSAPREPKFTCSERLREELRNFVELL